MVWYNQRQLAHREPNYENMHCNQTTLVFIFKCGLFLTFMRFVRVTIWYTIYARIIIFFLTCMFWFQRKPQLKYWNAMLKLCLLPLPKVWDYAKCEQFWNQYLCVASVFLVHKPTPLFRIFSLMKCHTLFLVAKKQTCRLIEVLIKISMNGERTLIIPVCFDMSEKKRQFLRIACTFVHCAAAVHAIPFWIKSSKLSVKWPVMRNLWRIFTFETNKSPRAESLLSR